MKHVIIVKLEVEADAWEDACEATESALDAGTFQDEINEYKLGVIVESVSCETESGFADVYKREHHAKIQAAINAVLAQPGALDTKADILALKVHVALVDAAEDL
jgi:hypothetical protein